MYQHTQPGYFIVSLMMTFAVFTIWLGLTHHIGLLVTPAIVIVLAAGYVFGSLTTRVDHERFTFWFGPGWFRRSLPLDDIASCETATNRWWYGLGIHSTPRGMLYNVSGRLAVELTLVDGRRLRVGTDEPVALCQAIRMMQGAGGQPPGTRLPPSPRVRARSARGTSASARSPGRGRSGSGTSGPGPSCSRATARSGGSGRRSRASGRRAP